MQDPRETRVRTKRNWVQVTPEPERVVGRDMSENIKSTSAVSSVQKTKTFARDAQNTNIESEKCMDPEVSDKLATLQSIFESGQRDTASKLDKLFGYVSREIKDRDVKIVQLKETEKSYHNLQTEHISLEKNNHILREKVHSYKLLSIVSTVLFLITSAISFLVKIY